MPSFKERILDNILRNQVSSVPELSHILGISKPAVQYHIQNLLLEGEIEPVDQMKSSTSRGRPVNYYRIAENRQPDNLAILADTLLSQFLASSTYMQPSDEKIAALARAMAGTENKSQSFIKQIDHCITRLGILNYQPHWEVTRNGSRIHLRNCPYARILPSHPELCRMDQIMLESMLGIPVQINQLWKDHPETRTGCEFFFTR
ncbi:MAG: winged helix-turn-helix transcriptional regulator [Chloroflexi bacterium]|nr:winged helix-turn-helix transcriptional regulator [Chloroflexota bacterium]